MMYRIDEIDQEEQDYYGDGITICDDLRDHEDDVDRRERNEVSQFAA